MRGGRRERDDTAIKGEVESSKWGKQGEQRAGGLMCVTVRCPTADAIAEKKAEKGHVWWEHECEG